MDIMEAVEIKTEPLYEEYNQFSQFNQEEIHIKSENDFDYIPPSETFSSEPVVQTPEDWLVPKEEPTHDSDEPSEPPEQFQSSIFSEEYSNKCNFCDMFVESYAALKHHERNCQFRNDCKLCGQKFQTSYPLITHLYKFHNQIMTNSSPPKNPRKELGRLHNVTLKNLDYKCNICNLKFANSRHLNNHKKKHYTCQQCGEYLKSYDALETHRCDNVVVKEEDENEVETPTKQIFQTTNSMVLIPEHTIGVPMKTNGEALNAKPKKRKSTVLFEKHSSEPLYQQNVGTKSDFTVVTKDTDFEQFAKPMMEGLTNISEPIAQLPETSSIYNNYAQPDANQAENIIVDSQGNVYKILSANFVCPPNETQLSSQQDKESSQPKIPTPFPLIIKDEPTDEPNTSDSTIQLSNQQHEKSSQPKIPTPFPLLIKDEPTDEQNTSDSTDVLLEELFDRKAKSIAKERMNTLKQNVMKKIVTNRSIASENKSSTSAVIPPPTKMGKRSHSFQNRISSENEFSNDSQYKPQPRKMKDDIPKNTHNKSPLVDNNTKKLPTLKNLMSDENFLKMIASVKNNSTSANVGPDEVPHKPIKTEDPDSPMHELSSGYTSKGEDIAELDFEDAIQSSTLPNFNKCKNIIQNLTEEYRKAQKVKLKEAPTFSEDVNQANPELPKENENTNKPSSFFFPMLEDSQVYNMVASALNEKYRYVWICPMCPKQYEQAKPFKKHLLTTHFKDSDELDGKSFELRPELVLESSSTENFCYLCHVTLADNATLRRHQFEMHKDQDLTLKQNKKKVQHRCYICNKRCSSRTLLAEHMKSNCGKNPQYACNVCDKKFHTQSTLNLHKTMHTGELPHSCEYCQKRFRTRGQLTVHTRTHTGEKPFPCKVCDQSFTHRETLIAHLSRHIDMKRYKCYGCNQFFTCISGLKTHRSVRPDTCGRFKLNARAVGPRVRVIKGNVIFEPQPIYNARLVTLDTPLETFSQDHNYSRKESNEPKNDSQQNDRSKIIDE